MPITVHRCLCIDHRPFGIFEVIDRSNDAEVHKRGGVRYCIYKLNKEMQLKWQLHRKKSVDSAFNPHLDGGGRKITA